MKQVNVAVTNETRHIEWYEMYNCKCTFSSSVCNNNVGMIINAGVKAKNWLIKVIHSKCIWNPSNCECKCYKSCDFSEYLDYKNCECKKRLGDKSAECSSAEECTENIEETRLAEIN